MRANSFSVVVLRHIAVPAQYLQIWGKRQADNSSVPIPLVSEPLSILASVVIFVIYRQEPRQPLTTACTLCSVVIENAQFSFPLPSLCIQTPSRSGAFHPCPIPFRAHRARPMPFAQLTKAARRTEAEGNFTLAVNFILPTTHGASHIAVLSESRAARVAKALFYSFFAPFIFVRRWHLAHGQILYHTNNVRDALMRLEAEILAA